MNTKPKKRRQTKRKEPKPQQAAAERIPHLLKIPAKVRFLSVEPLLGPVDLSNYLGWSWECPECGDDDEGGKYPLMGRQKYCGNCAGDNGRDVLLRRKDRLLHWVIVGGESGHGARPCSIEWIRSIVRQCQAADVPCFVKQLGSSYTDPENGICGKLTKWPFDILPNGRQAIRVVDRKGGDPEEWPEDLRVREIPTH